MLSLFFRNFFYHKNHWIVKNVPHKNYWIQKSGKRLTILTPFFKLDKKTLLTELFSKINLNFLENFSLDSIDISRFLNF